jgi:coenzyme F420 hydrogenase subunit beta
MRNFSYEKLAEFMKAKGVKLENVKKFVIRLETMQLEMEDGHDVELDLREVEEAGAVWDGCYICRDAVSKLADVSAGYTGTSKDWTTLIARNAKGLELIDAAEKAGYIETSSEVEVDRIEEFAGHKMRSFDRELKNRLEEEKPIKFYWARDYPGVRPEAKGTFFVKYPSPDFTKME